MKKAAPPPPGDYGFFNYATGEAADPGSFLNWSPGQGSAAPAQGGTPMAKTAAQAPAKIASGPKAGEKWQMIWLVNRPLSFLEMSAAKSAFRSQMTDQTLDSAMQNQGPPSTVVVTTTFTRDGAPIQPGQVLRKSDIVATLSSVRRIA
jgi:hypothetical protein